MLRAPYPPGVGALGIGWVCVIRLGSAICQDRSGAQSLRVLVLTTTLHRARRRMTEIPQDVNRHRQPTPQTKEDADLQMICAVILDDRLSDDQVIEVLRKITAPYLGEAEEVAQ